MLTLDQNMELTKKLMDEGVNDTTAWINSHSEEEALAYLTGDGNSEVVIITSPGKSIAEGEYCSPDIKKWCDSHGVRIEDFNQPVKLLDGITTCDLMFYECTSFNQPVTIPDTVRTAFGMFMGCEAFNQPITIPANVDMHVRMFSGCKSFNQPVTILQKDWESIKQSIPAKPKNILRPFTGNDKFDAMFYECTSFNQPITIPDTAITCERMFYGCTSFNQPIKIPRNVYKAKDMFKGCESFISTIQMPNRLIKDEVACPDEATVERY